MDMYSYVSLHTGMSKKKKEFKRNYLFIKINAFKGVRNFYMPGINRILCDGTKKEEFKEISFKIKERYDHCS